MVNYSKGVTQLALQAGLCVTFTCLHHQLNSKYRNRQFTFVKRIRRNVSDIMREIGPKFTRRAYRMHGESFWKLHRILFESDIPRKRKRGKTVNGDILLSHRLSMALRWMAGGSKFDISPNHGTSVDETMSSVWLVVDAVNKCDRLKLPFPTNHDKQQEIADAFKKKSKAHFANCVGCVDGMLVWIDRPSEKARTGSNVGSSKYFCGRKKKYGMVLQAVCDDHRRFLDFDISQPASTSDYLTFCSCDLLKKKLTQSGFLKPGLTLYGDNAYVNTSFMTTPFKAVSGGIKDSFNFYHSQLRINIECAFGMLVHRWGCLRKPIPVNISISRICALVKCLCILHNYCINERLLREACSNNSRQETNCDSVLAADSVSIMMNGGSINSRLDDNSNDIDIEVDRNTSMLDVGHHYDDCPTTRIRMHMGSDQFIAGNNLPRDEMLEQLEVVGLTTRPQKMGTTSTNLHHVVT